MQDVHGPTSEAFGSPIQRDPVFVSFPAGKGVVPAPVDRFPAARMGVAIEVESHLIAPDADPVEGRGVQQAVAFTKIGQERGGRSRCEAAVEEDVRGHDLERPARADGSRIQSDQTRMTGFSG